MFVGHKEAQNIALLSGAEWDQLGEMGAVRRTERRDVGET
jgi:hypothetical protein